MSNEELNLIIALTKRPARRIEMGWLSLFLLAIAGWVIYPVAWWVFVVIIAILLMGSPIIAQYKYYLGNQHGYSRTFLDQVMQEHKERSLLGAIK